MPTSAVHQRAFPSERGPAYAVQFHPPLPMVQTRVPYSPRQGRAIF